MVPWSKDIEEGKQDSDNKTPTVSLLTRISSQQQMQARTRHPSCWLCVGGICLLEPLRPQWGVHLFRFIKRSLAEKASAEFKRQSGKPKGKNGTWKFLLDAGATYLSTQYLGKLNYSI